MRPVILFLIRCWMLAWAIPYVAAWGVMFLLACVAFGPMAWLHVMIGGPALWGCWREVK